MSNATHDMHSSLAELRSIVGLVVFAIEARRVLQAVDAVADGMPQVDRALSMAIDVARWYTPDVRRTPAAIEATYGELAVRLVRPGEALAASALP